MRVSTRSVLIALAAFALLPTLTGCTYLKHVQRQNKLAMNLEADPELRGIKHLLDHERFTVYGRLIEAEPAAGASSALAVAAFSSALKPDELVDVCHLGPGGSYYALNLPAGHYRLVALRDLDGDGRFGTDEVVAVRELDVGHGTAPDRVRRLADLDQRAAMTLPLTTLPLAAVSRHTESEASVFYPPGTIRSLDDPIFSAPMIELGVYDPAAFTEIAPLMFYALEEDLGHKIPVVFVHGIGGSARHFAGLVERLDRHRFRPLFFHYPSGNDLRQNARIFHDVFLSGKVIPPSSQPMVIIAHSMGGLVVREALNLRRRSANRMEVRMLITLATPFGGMASAGIGARRAPLVVPAWRDLDPESRFIAGLHRRPRSAALEHHALYASKRLRETTAAQRGSDGVVPVASQLAAAALQEFTSLQGVETDHMGILVDEVATAHLLALLDSVPNQFQDDHLHFLNLGGFNLSLTEPPSPLGGYLIRHYGRYLRALVNGVIAPASPDQAQFVAAARGEVAAKTPGEQAWLAFQREHPQLADVVEPYPAAE